MAGDNRGGELWKTDGTSGGTSLVKDIYEGPESSTPGNMFAADDKLYFSAYTPDKGLELWNTDGTTDGTKLLVDVNAGPVYSNPRYFLKLNDNLLFVAQSAMSGDQLFAYQENVTATFEDINSRVSIYPNPSNAIFNVEGELYGSTLSVYNAAGSCVSVHTNLTGKARVDLGSLPEGLYFFRFVNNKKTFTMKVIRG
jgi:ELWxxDGT repeat protein